MSEHKVKVTIDGLGQSTVEAIGFQGNSCFDATSALEKALAGGQPGNAKVTLKEEFYASEPDAVEVEHES